MQTYILSIGNEILRGDILDTNAHWLSYQLGTLGCTVIEHITVGDSPRHLKKTLRRLSHCDVLVVVTGGLGPTDDDITREILSDIAGVQTRLHRRAWDNIRRRFAKGVPLPPNNRRQAMLPAGCTPFYNTCGTAPGFALKVGKATFTLMPGVPAEMKSMFTQSVVPWIQHHNLASAPAFIKKFKLYGIGESAAASRLGNLIERNQTPRVDITVSHSVITLTVVAQRTNNYKTELRRVYTTIRQQLGEYIFSEDNATLSETLVATLAKHGKKMSCAESCTGGMIASHIMDVPGASSVFEEGVVSYSNEAKQRTLGVNKKTLARFGAVSPETAAEMAEGILNKSGADIAVSTTGIAGPGGGTKAKPVGTVCFAIAQRGRPTKTWVKHFRGDRNQVRLRAVQMALHRLITSTPSFLT